MRRLSSLTAPISRRRTASALALGVLLGLGATAPAGAAVAPETPAGSEAVAPPSTPDERISTFREERTAIGERYRVGRQLTYRIRATNPSSRTARAVTVCGALPRGLRFVRATRGYAFRDGQLCWTATIGAHRTVERRIVGQVVGPRD